MNSMLNYDLSELFLNQSDFIMNFMNRSEIKKFFNNLFFSTIKIWVFSDPDPVSQNIADLKLNPIWRNV